MSTRSTIVLRLNDEDMGKTIQFNPDLLPTLEDGSKKEYVNDFPTPPVTLDGRYMEIYHHFDGYPDGVGDTLVKEFKTYEEILNLLSMGDMSTINGAIRSYRGWRNEDTPPSFSANEPSCSEEYIYLFKDGVWYFKDVYDIEEWTNLEEYLARHED